MSTDKNKCGGTLKEKLTKLVIVFAFCATVAIGNLSPLTASAAADTCTWTGTTSAAWATGTNWTGCDNSGVPENGDTLVFPSSASNKSMSNNLSGLTPDHIVISGTGYTFAGNALTNITSGNFYSASESATINLQTAFNGANTGATVAAGKTLTFSQPQAFGSSGGQYWTGGGSVIFNGNLTGSTGGMFRAESNTTVQVNGATNTFTSSFVGAESNATFECQSATCFGNNANAIYMGGGIVKIIGSYTFANGFATSTSNPNLSKLTANDNVSITGTGSVVDDLTIEQTGASKSLQFTGATSLTGSITVEGLNTSSNIKFDNGLSGAGGVAVNSGNAWMSGSHTFTGTVTVKSGAVAMADQVNSLGATSAPTIVESGGSLQLNSPGLTTIPEPLQIAGEGTGPTQFKGAIYQNGDDTHLTGTIALTGDATIYNESGSNDLVLEGVISGAHDITYHAIDGPNIQVGDSGGSANTYTGTTTVTGGIVYLEKSLAIPGDLIIDSTSPSTNAVTVYTYAPNAIADSATVTMSNEEDELRIGDAGTTEVIGGLVGTAGLVSFQYNDSDLAVDQDFNSTFGGKFYADGRSPDFIKRGTGNLTLTGSMQWNLDDDVNFIVEEGILTVNGDLSTTDGTNMLVKNTGTLKGTGTVGKLTSTGGTLAPGTSPGKLNVTSLTLDSTNAVDIELDGPVAGTSYDQIVASGAVNLADATLNIKPSYTPSAGQVFTIITGSSVTGTFKNMANNSTVIVDGITFKINYTSTSVTLTYVSGTYDPSGTLANTGTSMLLAAIASLMLIAAATALTTRRQRQTIAE